MTWRSWIGKPHGFGSDPEITSSADCLLMTVRVREELGLPVPDRRQVRQMLVWAGRRERRLLASMLKVHTYRINSAEPGSFWIRLTKPLYGVCVCVENGMLYVDHEQGVRWTRLDCVLHHTQFDWRHWQ